jgi:hypothetical protein
MRFSFTPKPYNQLMQDLLLKRGEGTFEITSVLQKDSKETKRPMLEIILKVTDLDKRTGRIKYFIMLDDDKDEVLNKLYKLCYSAGKGYLYDEGAVDERLVGGKGRLIIGVNKDKNNNDQNTVVVFIVGKENSAISQASALPINSNEPPPFVDDDLPFN